MKKFMLLFSFVVTLALGQNTIKVQVLDEETNEPLVGATVQVSATKGAIADANGIATLADISANEVTLTVSFVGYEANSVTVQLPQQEMLIVRLHIEEEHEEVIVTSTRTADVIEAVPTRIEVLGTEELEEKAFMRSSNIAMLLRETSGIQMQQTSPSAANQSIRIQGLDGRYTQLLKDGFPLFGGFAGGLSIMQIPPLDLQQVEIIKGANSTLFGGGAIAGLVNLTTVVPQEERKIKLMFDQTSAGGTTVNGFYAERFGKWGLSMYASGNRQMAYDANNDLFSDIPEIHAVSVNPSIFYYPNDRSYIRATFNGTFEDRLGGDMDIIDGESNGVHQFTQENLSNRLSLQLTYNNQLGEYSALTIKHSTNKFDRKITEPNYVFEGEQWSTFSEATYNFGRSNSRWVTGINVYTDDFTDLSGVTNNRHYQQNTAGAFIQNTAKLNNTLSLESGFRVDYNSEYGAFPLPKLALLKRVNEKLSLRLGGSLGYKLPTIFTEDAENLAFEGILPIDDELEVERAQGANFDFNYASPLGGDWSINWNQLFFYTNLEQSLVLQPEVSNTYRYINANGPVTSRGLETNVKLGYKDFKLFLNYTLIDTQLEFANPDLQKPLTPKHNAAFVLVYEQHGKWRIGYELYYTGEQLRQDLSRTSDFWVMGLMMMRKFNHIGVFVNFENFTDTRQHSLEAFDINDQLKPNTPNLWAPVDGFVVNGGVIFEF